MEIIIFIGILFLGCFIGWLIGHFLKLINYLTPPTIPSFISPFPVGWIIWQNAYRYFWAYLVGLFLGAVANYLYGRWHGHKKTIFLAYPMSSLSPADYASSRTAIIDLIAQMHAKYQVDIIYTGSGLDTASIFNSSAKALKDNMKSLNRSNLFILIYPQKLPTSSLVEVGYALSKRIPSIYIVKGDNNDLPHIIRGVTEVFPEYKIRPYNDDANLKTVFEEAIKGSGAALR